MSVVRNSSRNADSSLPLFLVLPPPSQTHYIRSNDYWSQQTLADLTLDRCGQPNLADNIERGIESIGELSDEPCHRLLEIANKCPVHRTLTSEIRVESRLSETQEERDRNYARPCEPRTMRAVARVLDQKGIDKWHKHSI
jgi:hypothetical protein